MGVTYACLALNVFLGYAFCAGHSSAWRGLTAGFLGSVLFFLITNFACWYGDVEHYPQTFAGLMQDYADSLIFFRGTLVGDVVYTVVLFAAHRVLVERTSPDAALMPENTASRSDS